MVKSNNKFDITIGADPEFFVIDKTGQVIPSCGKFGGTKKSPVLICDVGGYLEDGATVEFNVTPAKSLREVSGHVDAVAKAFLEKFPDYDFYSASTAGFTQAVLKANPATMHIGCSADKYVYGLRTAPQINRFKRNRFAGGHIHVGMNPWPEGLTCESLVTILDFLVYCYNYKRADAYRYPFYGIPGLFRDTDYGVEWRSPDNFWCNPKINKAEKGQFITTFDKTMTTVSVILEKSSDGRVLEELVKEWVADYSVKKTAASTKFKTSIVTFAQMQSYANVLRSRLEQVAYGKKLKNESPAKLKKVLFEIPTNVDTLVNFDDTEAA